MKLSSAPWAQDLWQVETSIAKTQFGDPELLPLKVESCLTSCSKETTHSYRLAAQHIGPSDPAKQPDLLDFFVKNGISSTYFDIEPSYDLSSDQSPIIETINTSPNQVSHARLHNSRTNWRTYRTTLHENIQLTQRLKNSADVETATHDLIRLLQAAIQATPPEDNNKIRHKHPPGN